MVFADAPCKGCTERSGPYDKVNCHTICTKFLEFKKQNEQIRAKKRNDDIAHNVHVESCKAQNIKKIKKKRKR